MPSAVIIACAICTVVEDSVSAPSAEDPRESVEKVVALWALAKERGLADQVDRLLQARAKREMEEAIARLPCS